MTDPITVSPAMENYLEAILDVAEKSGVVRVTDVAAKLNIAKASVTQAISNLKELGLVTQYRYGPIELTRAGKKMAVKVQHRHRTLKKFLVEILGVDQNIAERDACLIEHVVSPQTMEKLIEFLGTYCHTSSGPGAAENPLLDEGKE